MMSAAASAGPTVAPRTVLLLFVAYLCHVTEEWFGGFPDWAATALGASIDPERFLFINSVGVLVFAFGTLAAVRDPRAAWFGVAMAALFGLNGVVHVVFTVALGRYSPGTVTGLLLFLPLSAGVLRSSWSRMPRAVFTRAIVFGILLHGVATLSALL